MSTKLKALGLALFAMFAFGAIAAQGAMAEGEEFHSESATTYLTAHQIEGTNEFYLDDGSGFRTTCKKATFETTDAIEGKAFTEATVHPTYEECETFEEEDTTVLTDECHYVLTSGLKPSTEGEEHAPVEIEECAGSIEIIVEHLCKIYITDPQNDSEDLSHGVVYTNEPSNENHTYVIAEATVHSIHWEVTTSFFCTVGGLKAHTGNDGTYFNTLTVEGFKDAAHTEHTAIWWE